MIAQAPATDKNTDLAQPDNTVKYVGRDIPIEGRFDKYRSPYWAGVVAALGMRYFPRPFWRDSFAIDSHKEPDRHFEKHKYSGFAGIILNGIAGLFAYKTYHDIRSIFAESVAWESGKRTEDVSFLDLWNSKNSMVQQTMSNYAKFNVLRFGVNTVYFLPFLMKKQFQKWNLNGETGVDWGVSANAAYLTRDIIVREMTAFEELQSLIDRKINHAEHYADHIVTTDLLDVYERHATHDQNKSFIQLRGTPKWEQALKLFARMADLMDQTYHNTVRHEEARFGFSKFVSLIGTQKIDPEHLDRSLAYVEIANQYGMEEVNKAAKKFAEGAAVEEVLARYPLVDLQRAAETPLEDAARPVPLHQKIIDKKQPTNSHAQRELAHRQEPANGPGQLAI